MEALLLKRKRKRTNLLSLPSSSSSIVGSIFPFLPPLFFSPFLLLFFLSIVSLASFVFSLTGTAAGTATTTKADTTITTTTTGITGRISKRFTEERDSSKMYGMIRRRPIYHHLRPKAAHQRQRQGFREKERERLLGQSSSLCQSIKSPLEVYDQYHQYHHYHHYSHGCSSSFLWSTSYAYATDDHRPLSRVSSRPKVKLFVPSPSPSTSSSLSTSTQSTFSPSLLLISSRFHTNSVCYLNRILFEKEEIYIVKDDKIHCTASEHQNTIKKENEIKSEKTLISMSKKQTDKDNESNFVLPFLKDLPSSTLLPSTSSSHCFALLPPNDKRAIHIRNILKKGRQQNRKTSDNDVSNHGSEPNEIVETIRVGVVDGSKNDNAPLEWIPRKMLLEETNKGKYCFLSNVDEVKEKIREEERKEKSLLSLTSQSNEVRDQDTGKITSEDKKRKKVSKAIKQQEKEEDYLYIDLGLESNLLQPITEKERPSVSLLLAMQRPLQLQRMLVMSAQLGVDRIVLINSNKVEKSFFGSHLLREKDAIHELLIEGTTQASCTILPRVSVEKRLKIFLEDRLDTLFPQEEYHRIFAHPFRRQQEEKEDSEGEEQGQGQGDSKERTPNNERDSFDPDSYRLTSYIREQKQRKKKIVLAIGPESGWEEPYELDLWQEYGFQQIHLGERILRTDVALVSLISLAQEALATTTTR